MPVAFHLSVGSEEDAITLLVVKDDKVIAHRVVFVCGEDHMYASNSSKLNPSSRSSLSMSAKSSSL